MSKILESLPMTIVAGVVLTVIMVIATQQINNMNQSDTENTISDLQQKID